MRLNPDFIKHDTDKGAVLIAVGKTGEKFKGMVNINKTGSFIVDHLKEETTFETLLADIIKEYKIDEETAKNDLDAFLAGLRKIKAVLE